MSDGGEAFAAWLRAELAARGLRQKDLAAAIGVTPSAVCPWVAGRTRPDPASRARLAAVLGLAPGDLPGEGRFAGTPARADPDPASAGARLGRAMAERGWSARELGERAGMPQATVTKYRAGKRRPGPAARARLEAALGLEPGDLG